MHSFEINWGVVAESDDHAHVRQTYALWPAPVNDDQCFAEAGFSHFQSDDEDWSESHWDRQAEILQQRVLTVLAEIGNAVVLSEPLVEDRSLFRFWKPGEPLPVAEQLRWPILNDSLPEVVIRFGSAVELCAGSGHELYWISRLPDCPVSFETLLAKLAAGWPVKQVQLDWSKLGFTRLGGSVAQGRHGKHVTGSILEGRGC